MQIYERTTTKELALQLGTSSLNEEIFPDEVPVPDTQFEQLFPMPGLRNSTRKKIALTTAPTP